MEEQSSMLLQKKMILAMSLIILALVVGISYTQIVYKDVIMADKEVFVNEIITEKKEENKEDGIILIEQISYAAAEEITEKEDDVEKEDTQEEFKKEEEEQKTESYVTYKDLAEDNPPTEYKQVIEVTATAYCLCEKCCGKAKTDPGYGVTASGFKIIPGTGVKAIAVDPDIVPLGSKVYVEGLNGSWDYGYATAYDTGGAINNLKIDLYMDTHAETLNWGVKKVNLYII